MTLQTLLNGAGYFVPQLYVNNSTGAGDSLLTVNGAGEYVAVAFIVPKDGNIQSGGVTLDTIAGAQDLIISLQDLDASGLPDGTADQFRVLAGGSLVADAYNDFGIISDDGTDTGALRAVTKGQLLAVKCEFNSTVGDVDFEANSIMAPFEGFPNTILNGNKAQNNSCFHLEYDDGTPVFILGQFPYTSISSLVFNSGDTANEYGNSFTLPFASRFTGIHCFLDPNSRNYTFSIYQGTSTTPLATKAFTTDIGTNPGSGFPRNYLFDGTVDLTAGQEYRITVTAAEANDIRAVEMTFDNSGRMDAMPGGSNFHRVERGGGAWTDTALSQVMIMPLLDAFDDAAGGGGGETSHVF